MPDPAPLKGDDDPCEDCGGTEECCGDCACEDCQSGREAAAQAAADVQDSYERW